MLDIVKQLQEQERLYLELGRICIHFQTLEEALKYLGVSLTFEDNSSNVNLVEANRNLGKFIDVLIKLTKSITEIEEQKRTELVNILKSVVEIKNERNELIHSVWARYPDTKGRVSIKSIEFTKNGVASINKSKIIDADYLSNFADRIDTITSAIVAYYRDPIIDELLKRLDK